MFLSFPKAPSKSSKLKQASSWRCGLRGGLSRRTAIDSGVEVLGAHCLVSKWALNASCVLLQGIGFSSTTRRCFFSRNLTRSLCTVFHMECASPEGSFVSWSCTHLILSLRASRFALFLLDLASGWPSASAFLAAVSASSVWSEIHGLARMVLLGCFAHGVGPTVLRQRRHLNLRHLRHGCVRSVLLLCCLPLVGEFVGSFVSLCACVALYPVEMYFKVWRCGQRTG